MPATARTVAPARTVAKTARPRVRWTGASRLGQSFSVAPIPAAKPEATERFEPA